MGGMGSAGAPDILCALCREAIGLVCEAVPGAKGAVRRRKVRLGRVAAGGCILGHLGTKLRVRPQLAVPVQGSLKLWSPAAAWASRAGQEWC